MAQGEAGYAAGPQMGMPARTVSRAAIANNLASLAEMPSACAAEVWKSALWASISARNVWGSMPVIL
jgi:hypothetical protein